jgi:hypothetical protein
VRVGLRIRLRPKCARCAHLPPRCHRFLYEGSTHLLFRRYTIIVQSAVSAGEDKVHRPGAREGARVVALAEERQRRRGALPERAGRRAPREREHVAEGRDARAEALDVRVGVGRVEEVAADATLDEAGEGRHIAVYRLTPVGGCTCACWRRCGRRAPRPGAALARGAPRRRLGGALGGREGAGAAAVGTGFARRRGVGLADGAGARAAATALALVVVAILAALDLSGRAPQGGRVESLGSGRGGGRDSGRVMRTFSGLGVP